MSLKNPVTSQGIDPGTLTESTLNQCTARPLTESDIPDAVKYYLDLLKMSILLLETCGGI
jgi:hypothetical protein